jgi:hypothetical protein
MKATTSTTGSEGRAESVKASPATAVTAQKKESFFSSPSPLRGSGAERSSIPNFDTAGCVAGGRRRLGMEWRCGGGDTATREG